MQIRLFFVFLFIINIVYGIFGNNFENLLQVVIQQQHQQPNDEKDPFAAIRELGQRSNGLYNYFH